MQPTDALDLPDWFRSRLETEVAALSPPADLAQDVMLARAAAAGFLSAVRLFERTCLEPFFTGASPSAPNSCFTGASPSAPNSLWELREVLFAGHQPLLLAYRGEAPLVSWTRQHARQILRQS